MQFMIFKKGQTIFTENDKVDRVYMIIRGKINIYKLKNKE